MFILLKEEKKMEYVLEMRQFSKRYGNNRVLNNITMKLPQGTIYGLVGTSETGNKTLIRVLCGLQDTSKNDYAIFKQDNNSNMLNIRKNMGTIIEAPAIYLNMSARDNIIQQYMLLGITSFRGVDELLELVGLGNVGVMKVKDFSLGMRQRLAVAMAIIGEPDYLILDEPIDGMDSYGMMEIRQLLLRLNREKGITVLISNHILDELSRIDTYYGNVDKSSVIKEISARQLENSCYKCVQLTVSNMGNLVRALEKYHLEYEVVSESKANIFSSASISKLVEVLQFENCEILLVEENNGSLDNYYMNLVG